MTQLLINAVGTAAALFSMTSFVPQVLKIWKERDASSVSLRMYVVTVVGFSLWTAYGVMPYQVVGAPKWPWLTLFTIEAKGDSDADAKLAVLTKEQQKAEQQKAAQRDWDKIKNSCDQAALQDFIKRFYKAAAALRKDPLLAAQTYVKTYGVTLPVAKAAVASVQAVGTPITPAIISYQQTEANTFQKLGLIPGTLNVKSIFDLPYNKIVAKNSNLTS